MLIQLLHKDSRFASTRLASPLHIPSDIFFFSLRTAVPFSIIIDFLPRMTGVLITLLNSTAHRHRFIFTRGACELGYRLRLRHRSFSTTDHPLLWS